ncbi:MAG TPA: NAD-dependent epimerase/dehydratase family protein [Chloroflexota bacterium]|nr:NAD-dependent epimerase/dehydratase family protein [Chloroflexota bacterium]
MKMRVLVTGATGFLGTHLVRRLLAEGACVRALVRSAMKAQPLLREGVELVVGEITDGEALCAALDDVAVVYHLAGKLFMPGVPTADYYKTHVEGTRLLLSVCRARPRLERFVQCSTTGVLGATGDHAADEAAPYRPTNAYEQTKAQAEVLVRAAAQEGVRAVIVRPGLVYGPGDRHLLGFFRAIQRQQFRPIGRRSVWLHPIYIDDLTEALVRCGQHPRAVGECFHLAGPAPVTIARLAATIARAEGVAPPRGRIALPMARVVALAGDLLPARLQPLAPLTRSRLDFLTHSRVYNVAKARHVLDFAAAIDLPTGIGRSVAWYRQHGYLPAGPEASWDVRGR